MKFKINVFRDILIYLEENLSYDDSLPVSTEIHVKEYSPDDIAYHIELIAEEGLIVFDDETGINSDRYRELYIKRLTMKGHEFLSSVRNDTVWNKMVEGSKLIGVEIIKSTIPILFTYAKTQLGLP